MNVEEAYEQGFKRALAMSKEHIEGLRYTCCDGDCQQEYNMAVEDAIDTVNSIEKIAYEDLPK